MATLISDRYTPTELAWLVSRYYAEFNGQPPSLRTIRHWRQRLGIVPDDSGHYWQSDLERLQDAVRRLRQGCSLAEIAKFQAQNY